MTYRVVFSATARTDIRENARWLNRQGSITAADRWYAELIKSLNTLRRLPERQPIAEEESEHFGFTVHQMLYGRRPNVYRILFAVDGDSVTLISVRHSARGHLEN